MILGYLDTGMNNLVDSKKSTYIENDVSFRSMGHKLNAYFQYFIKLN